MGGGPGTRHMPRLMLLLLSSVVALTLAPRLTPARADASVLVESSVLEHSREQGMVGFQHGQDAGVSVGDPFWVLGETGVVASGEIFFVTSDRSAGRLDGAPSVFEAGATAVLLKREALPGLRDRLPPGATVAGRIARLPPGRHTGWIDIHAGSGLRVDDGVVVLRKGLLISRGRVRLVDAQQALVTLQPLVSNALPEPGDRVELWPAPADARWGRLNSIILAVQKHPPGTLEPFEITIAGSADDGIAADRLVDVFRGHRYVGLARIVQVATPNSIARMPDVQDGATTTQPALGDTAIVRAPIGAPRGPMTVPVFNKVDAEYCLVAAGEMDGIALGETFLVRRQDPVDPLLQHEVALLTVVDLSPAHCGAEVKPLTSQVPSVQVGDMAERQLEGVEQWRPVGIIERTDPATRTALAAVAPGCRLQPGAIVAWMPEGQAPTGAAIVLVRETDRVLLHVPPGWGDMQLAPRSRVDALK